MQWGYSPHIEFPSRMAVGSKSRQIQALHRRDRSLVQKLADRGNCYSTKGYWDRRGAPASVDRAV